MADFEAHMSSSSAQEEEPPKKIKYTSFVVGSNVTDSKPSLQDAFVKFKKAKQESIKEAKMLKKKRAKMRSDPIRMAKLRKKFMDQVKKYFGYPYARKYWAKNTPEYHSPLFLDCCGLVRQVMRDLRQDFGFCIGPWNQAYMFDTLPIDIYNEEDMKPGDLVFMSGIYTNPKSKKQVHNMTHVEIWAGDGCKTIGARWNNGKVQVWDDYMFKAKSFHSEQYYFKSIDTWLKGICKSHCPQHTWKRRKFKPKKKSVFAVQSDSQGATQTQQDQKAGDDQDFDQSEMNGQAEAKGDNSEVGMDVNSGEEPDSARPSPYSDSDGSESDDEAEEDDDEEYEADEAAEDGLDEQDLSGGILQEIRRMNREVSYARDQKGSCQFREDNLDSSEKPCHLELSELVIEDFSKSVLADVDAFSGNSSKTDQSKSSSRTSERTRNLEDVTFELASCEITDKRSDEEWDTSIYRVKKDDVSIGTSEPSSDNLLNGSPQLAKTKQIASVQNSDTCKTFHIANLPCPDKVSSSSSLDELEVGKGDVKDQRSGTSSSEASDADNKCNNCKDQQELPSGRSESCRQTGNQSRTESRAQSRAQSRVQSRAHSRRSPTGGKC